MMSNNKRKAEGKDPLPEEKVLIEETWEVRGDGHKILDWTLRNTIRPINGDPDVYWKEGTWKSELAPVLGSNLTTEHLFPLSVNPGTIRRLYNSNRLIAKN